MLKLAPLLVFAALVALLAKGLTLDPTEVPSPLIDAPAPAFTLPVLDEADTAFDSTAMAGKVWLLNVWASWCVACVTEHPRLLELAARENLPIVGLNYKDAPDAALTWLDRHGNPYTTILDDREGRVGLDWGVYGVPETFVVDRAGVIRYKHIGPLDESTLSDIVHPLLDELKEPAT